MTGNPVFCAVDTTDLSDACHLARALAPHVGGLKLGLEFWNSHGAPGVAEVMARAPKARLFLDLKLHDIPNTVAGAIRALGNVDFDILTVHAGGGSAMMRAAKAAAPGHAAVVGVTVLTSLDDDDLSAMGVPGGSGAQVARLAALARDSGLDGIVCSPREVADRRADWAAGLFVVPGIRPAGSDIGDQKRVMTPVEARDAGAGILVIGRPITAAPDPAAAAQAIAAVLSARAR
ncbi:orotidine-5'-phosphate decarboxylase [Pacificimonas sp. WHA3]|uniref:Orotidine 5'-phosphate decarboxylase n=1 Tax=Pacificimonas pallii TaxID=2827236 RepID=A0ABS6SI07_9SPHN|nr:orotidine-5'-phosphate decarboxylase [Pacificimonas pallii]MBV7257561.1 orotidine-5'-phosphate decarboxylase [Pacificimonas pallii]